MVVAFGLWSGSGLIPFICSNLFISGIDYYTRREVSFIAQGLFYLYVLYWVYFIGFILFIVLWDIAHAVFLQLLACKEPPCDGVEPQ
jgi:hypothetical protein